MAEKPSEQSELQYARDVMIAVRHMGQIVKTSDLEGSTFAKYLHDWASASAENETKLLTQMAQKSIDILQKYGNKEQDDAIASSERRTILDLKLRLAEAVEAASEISSET